MNTSFLKVLKYGLQAALAAGAVLVSGIASAQIIHMPAVSMTVADCRPGDSWQVRNGVERCQPILPPDSCANHGLYAWNQGGGSTYVPGVGTCYYAYTPPPPAPVKKPGQSAPIASVVGVTFGANGTFTSYLLIDNATSSLVCYGVLTSFNNTPGDTPDQYYYGPFATDYGVCSLGSNSGYIWGSCDNLAGGDNNSCAPGSHTVTTSQTSQCIVTYTVDGSPATYNTCQ